MKANRVFAKTVVLEAVQADPGFLDTLLTDRAGWLERKWAYACGFAGETAGDDVPEVVCRSPVVVRVPGADDANDVVYLTARGGQLYCLERTLTPDGSRVSDTEGAYVMRAGERGAFIDVTELSLDGFLRCLGPAPSPAPAPSPSASMSSEADPSGSGIGNALVFGMFGGMLGALLGFGFIAMDLGGSVLLWSCAALGVLLGIAAGMRFTRWQRSST